MELQKLLHMLYPPQCALCRELVEDNAPLCSSCWADTPFIDGLVCDCCGVPLMGEDDGDRALCDACLTTPRPWSRGRAVLEYRDNGRRLVLALKHGDRQDLVAPMGRWLARTARDLTNAQSLVVPVPLHWLRLARRRFNQAAALANALAGETSLDVCPDALVRVRHTPAQSGTIEHRQTNLLEALRPHPHRGSAMDGRHILLVDDVMTSGATFAAATQACREAGARRVSVLSLARVVKAP